MGTVPNKQSETPYLPPGSFQLHRTSTGHSPQVTVTSTYYCYLAYVFAYLVIAMRGMSELGDYREISWLHGNPGWGQKASWGRCPSPAY